MEDLYDLDHGTDEAAAEEDPRDAADPIAKLKMVELVGQQLQQLAAQDGAFCQACSSELTEPQTRALQLLFNQQ